MPDEACPSQKEPDRRETAGQVKSASVLGADDSSGVAGRQQQSAGRAAGPGAI